MKVEYFARVMSPAVLIQLMQRLVLLTDISEVPQMGDLVSIDA
jgi:hypothetical protein